MLSLRPIVATFICMLCIMICATPFAQEPLTEREKQLLDLVERLDQRVTDLEKRLEIYESQEPAPAPELEERMTQLEEEVEEATEKKGKDFRVRWNDGLQLDSYNEKYKLKFGGRIQNDWGWFSLGDELDFAGRSAEDGTEFRRARLFIGGDIYENFAFKAQYDFANNQSEFKDMYLAFKNVPYIGKITVGHFKEPFGLEALGSSKHSTFMEKALPFALTPGRNTGVEFTNDAFDKRMGYALGFFQETDSFGDGQDNNGGQNITGRITGTPWYAQEGRRVFHLGAAATRKDVDGTYRYRQRPEAHMVDVLVDTNPVMTDSITGYNLESALVVGPFSLQGEYTWTELDGSTGTSDADFDGYYAQISYFLTGEHRPYKPGAGTFGKIDPENNFKGFGEGGSGAWELAARISSLDLNDGTLRGGEIDNYTLGINWYLNANLRITLNYVHGDVERDLDIFDLDNIIPAYDDDFDAIMTRFQVTW